MQTEWKKYKPRQANRAGKCEICGKYMVWQEGDVYAKSKTSMWTTAHRKCFNRETMLKLQ